MSSSHRNDRYSSSSSQARGSYNSDSRGEDRRRISDHRDDRHEAKRSSYESTNRPINTNNLNEDKYYRDYRNDSGYREHHGLDRRQSSVGSNYEQSQYHHASSRNRHSLGHNHYACQSSGTDYEPTSSYSYSTSSFDKTRFSSSRFDNMRPPLTAQKSSRTDSSFKNSEYQTSRSATQFSSAPHSPSVAQSSRDSYTRNASTASQQSYHKIENVKTNQSFSQVSASRSLDSQKSASLHTSIDKSNSSFKETFQQQDGSNYVKPKFGKGQIKINYNQKSTLSLVPNPFNDRSRSVLPPPIKKENLLPFLIPIQDNLKDYEILDQVGEGTFGKVYKGKRTKDNALVALKRVRIEMDKEGLPVTAIREIRLLTSLQHKNVVKLHELLTSIIEDKGLYIYMVFEYMEHDLTGILSRGIPFEAQHLKCLMKQLIEGLVYIHSKLILHRDLKGSNILLNSKGELKIADFGLARFEFTASRPKQEDYTNRVITLWYRPPELLLGCTSYTASVDMWSAGCIFLELIEKQPVLLGKDEVTQLDKIWRMCGSPDLEVYPDVVLLPWWDFLNPCTSFPNMLRHHFSSKMSPEGLNLVELLLSLNPTQRPTAKAVLDHEYFRETPKACEPSQIPLVDGDWHEYESKILRKKAPDVVPSDPALNPGEKDDAVNSKSILGMSDDMSKDHLMKDSRRGRDYRKRSYYSSSSLSGSSRSRSREKGRRRSKSYSSDSDTERSKRTRRNSKSRELPADERSKSSRNDRHHSKVGRNDSPGGSRQKDSRYKMKIEMKGKYEKDHSVSRHASSSVEKVKVEGQRFREETDFSYHPKPDKDTSSKHQFLMHESGRFERRDEYSYSSTVNSKTAPSVVKISNDTYPTITPFRNVEGHTGYFKRR